MLPAHEKILSIQLVTNNKYARQVRSCAAGLSRGILAGGPKYFRGRRNYNMNYEQEPARHCLASASLLDCYSFFFIIIWCFNDTFSHKK